MACRDFAQFEIWKGEGYCNYFRKNTEGSDTCSHDTSGGGGCYITTIVCHALGYADDCPLMQTLRRFRTEVLQAKPQYADILSQYDTVGPLLSRRIQQDTEQVDLARSTYTQYLQPIAALIDGQKEKEAVDRYRQMVNALGLRYGVDVSA